LTSSAIALYGRIMSFNRTNRRATLRRRISDDDGLRHVRRPR
jgi:hypothetical protein